jgi:hypothetical protein
MKFKTNKRELLSAGLLLMIGLGAAIGGTNYNIGSLSRMGPGFFPVALGILLIIISALMIATPVTEEDEGAENAATQPQYRAWACVVLGVTAFMAFGSYAGLVPGTFFLVFFSALGDKGNTLKSVFWLAVGVTIMAVVLFRMLLQIQIPLFAWM